MSAARQFEEPPEAYYPDEEYFEYEYSKPQPKKRFVPQGVTALRLAGGHGSHARNRLQRGSLLRHPQWKAGLMSQFRIDNHSTNSGTSKQTDVETPSEPPSVAHTSRTNGAHKKPLLHLVMMPPRHVSEVSSEDVIPLEPKTPVTALSENLSPRECACALWDDVMNDMKTGGKAFEALAHDEDFGKRQKQIGELMKLLRLYYQRAERYNRQRAPISLRLPFEESV